MKSKKKNLKHQQSGEWEGYEECEDSSHFFVTFLIFMYFLSLIFPGIIWTPLECNELI